MFNKYDKHYTWNNSMAVLPILLTSRIKRKSDRKAVTLICKILGAFLVLWGLYNLIF